LTGCTTVTPPEPTARPTSTPKPRPTSTGAATAPVEVVVATGTFASAIAQVTGGVVVTEKGGSYTARLTGFTSSDTSGATIAFSDEPIAADGCVTDLYQLAFSAVDVATNGDMALNVRPAAIDPGYLESVVVARSPIMPPVEGACTEPTVAVAPLAWTLPDPFPDLGPAVDGGAVPAASGLSWTEEGVVLSYRTAPNDKMATIADRFGLTVAEIGYLNPERPMQYKDGDAYVDEILNLARSGR
jgi:hypothetical protein